MDLAIALGTLAIVHLMAVMSPGPAFVMISRTALAAGRRPAYVAALAMGIGVLFWAVGAMLGLALLFERAQWLYALVKVGGGLYLSWLAVMAWRGASLPVILADEPAPASSARSAAMWPTFRDGFLTIVANPKVAVFFGSIFVAVLPPDPSPLVQLAILAIVFVNEVGWYMVVGTLFSSAGPRAAYIRLKGWIDRGMALVLGCIGARLIWDAT